MKESNPNLSRFPFTLSGELPAFGEAPRLFGRALLFFWGIVFSSPHYCCNFYSNHYRRPAPEILFSCMFARLRPGAPLISSGFLRGLCYGKKVRLRHSRSSLHWDGTSSRRILAYVFVDDGGRLIDVNAEICEQGYTYWYSKYPHDRREEFKRYGKCRLSFAHQYVFIFKTLIFSQIPQISLKVPLIYLSFMGHSRPGHDPDHPPDRCF
jgi:hypothetical protein